MNVLNKEFIKNCKKSHIVDLAVEQSQLLVAATKTIKNLEKQVESLSVELGSKNQQVLFTADTLNRMKDQIFGQSSEKRFFKPGPLFDHISDEKSEEKANPSKTPKVRKNFGPTSQPNLPVQDCRHFYSKEDVKKHGLIEWEGQFEVSELISVIPSKVILQKHYRQKYFKTDPMTGEKMIITCPGPVKLKEKNRYSLELGVEMGLAKYLWHLPLDRQVKMFAAQDLDIKSQTIYGQIDTIAWYLKNTVFKGIANYLNSQKVLQADDTTWKNLAKADQKDCSKFYLWGVCNPKAVCYNIFNARSQKVAKDFLGEIKGTLVTDGHSSFKPLAGENLILANDWSHLRRKFVKAEKNFPEDSCIFLDKIGDLFEIERNIKEKPPDERLETRQTQSKLIIESIRQEIDLSNALPESALGKAFCYANTLWEGLVVFLSDPEVPMHTNDIERMMRSPAVGRKNHYGSKNMESAKVAAIWYSVVNTCKLNEVDPREYLICTLQAILTKQPYQMPWEFPKKP